MGKNIAIIFAGGVGARMGSGLPKQFIEVNGKPIIIHTLDIFEEHPHIDEIYVSCKEEYIRKLRKLADNFLMYQERKLDQKHAPASRLQESLRAHTHRHIHAQAHTCTLNAYTQQFFVKTVHIFMHISIIYKGIYGYVLCMYIYEYVYTHIYTCTYVYTCTYTHAHVTHIHMDI